MQRTSTPARFAQDSVALSKAAIRLRIATQYLTNPAELALLETQISAMVMDRIQAAYRRVAQMLPSEVLDPEALMKGLEGVDSGNFDPRQIRQSLEDAFIQTRQAIHREVMETIGRKGCVPELARILIQPLAESPSLSLEDFTALERWGQSEAYQGARRALRDEIIQHARLFSSEEMRDRLLPSLMEQCQGDEQQATRIWNALMTMDQGPDVSPRVSAIHKRIATIVDDVFRAAVKTI